MRTKVLSLMACVVLVHTACDFLDDPLICQSLVEEHSAMVQAGSAMLASLPEEGDQTAFQLLLNEPAINAFFANVADTDLPTLTESVRVLGQRIAVEAQPSLPLIALGGFQRCAQCVGANVPFSVALDLGPLGRVRGQGSMAAELPIGFMGQEDGRTAFIAKFQSVEVVRLTLDLPNSVAQTVLDAVEPVLRTLLTSYLQARFRDVPLVSFQPWSFGGGISLAPRGPYVYRDRGVIRFALVSNLPLDTLSGLTLPTTLPAGADALLSLHPTVFSAVGRRLTYTGAIPQSYASSGEPDAAGPLRFAMRDVQPSTTGAMRLNGSLFRTSSFCGAIDLSAALAAEVSPAGVGFSLGEVATSNPRGSAQLLARADELAGGALTRLLASFDLTANYDGDRKSVV